MSVGLMVAALWVSAVSGYLLRQWWRGELDWPVAGDGADGYATSMSIARREGADGEYAGGPGARPAG